MTIEKIQSSLQEIFDKPLREYHKRRIVFWYDSERQFEEMLGDLELPGVKLIKLTGSNNFEAKKTLVEDDIESDFLVYHPLPNAGSKEDWLVDIELYSDEFRADLLSMRMQEFGVMSGGDMRKTMKLYSRFFENKERVAKFKAFKSEYTASGQIHIDVMAVLARTKDNSAPGVIRAVLEAGLNDEENEAIENIKKFGSEDVFWRIAERYTGYVRPEGASGGVIIALAAHILFTALSVTMRPAFLGGFEKFISEAHQQLCYSFINEWMESEYGGGDSEDTLYEIAREVEEKYDLAVRFGKLEPEDLMESECFPCINECIIGSYLAEIADGVIKAENIAAVVEKRRVMKWYSRVEPYFEGMQCAADMQRFCQENADGFHVSDHKKLWNDYCEKLYKMDMFYRRFHTAFGRSLKEPNAVLEDIYKSAADSVENLYKNRYLASLGRKWTDLIVEEMEKDHRLNGIPQQEDFYRDIVKPVSNGGRVYVIVSDALRYEVAAELTEQLVSRTRGTAELSAVQGIFPSITKFGMAAMLPHDFLMTTASADELRVLCDGMPVGSTVERELVLQSESAGNVAFTYKELLKMKQAERRERVSGADVVYIYHNSIDAAGDKNATEDQVFEACDRAVDEIKNLVKIITGSLSGTNIIITADHGFIYSYRPLEEHDKAEMNFVSGDIVESGHRYVVAKGECRAEHMMKIRAKHIGEGFSCFAPLDYIRIKKPGGGVNYVHGGISLQECVVPVIKFKNMRASAKKFVDVQNVGLQLISRSRRVSNSIFSLDFYQVEAVGGKNVPAAYEICMEDAAGNAVSDRQMVIADRTAENSAERVFKVRFTLKGLEFKKTDAYYITVIDADTKETVERTEFSINIAFTNDFDF